MTTSAAPRPPRRFRILGPVEFFGDDGWTPVPAAKQRTLLAILLLNANRVVPVRQLVAELWSDKPRGRASSLLAGCVWRLRAVLGDDGTTLVTRAAGYQLTVAPGALDMHEYEALVTAGRAARTAENLTGAGDAFAAALKIWRGVPLADVALTSSVMAETARLEESRLAVAEANFGVQIGLGHHEEVLPELKLMVSQHPLRERLHEQLMMALYRSGQQADALGAYRDLRHLLVDELGIEPSKPLRELQRRILAEDPGLLVVAEAPPGVVSRPIAPPPEPGAPNLLPPDVTTFVGRDAELATITARLSEPGAVCSVYGLAGSGKSALVLRAAHALADRFPDGRVHLDLRASATDSALGPAEVLRGLNAAFGVDEPAGSEDLTTAAAHWRAAMGGKRALIVLDDVADTRQVRAVLPPPPGCAVLLAGRTAAGPVDGRSHVRLGRLTVDTSIELLRAVAGAERLDDDPDAAAEIARGCEYLPLALHLAAGRLAVRPDWAVTDFARRLSRPGNRLDLLDSGERGLRECLRGGIRQLRRAGDDTAVSALNLLAALDLPMVTVPMLATLFETGEGYAQTVAERLVDAGLLESLAMERYRVPESVRLMAAEATGISAELSAGVQRVVDHYVHAVRDRIEPPELDPRTAAGEPPETRLAWYRRQRATLLALAVRDQTDTLHKAVDELRRTLVNGGTRTRLLGA